MPHVLGDSARKSKAINSRSLLTAGADRPGDVPFDVWHRYRQAAQLIDEICRSNEGVIKILDVGCNVVKLFDSMLDSDRVQVVRCDVIDGPPDDSDYVKLEPNAALPFEENAFDIVVALEVLEHLPKSRRRNLISDLSRVARQAVMFSCPVHSPLVQEAERVTNEAYQLRH